MAQIPLSLQLSITPSPVPPAAWKRVDNATYEISKACVDGNLESGIVTYDLKSEGVDIAPTTDNLPEEVLTAVEEVKEKIKSGELHVFAGPLKGVSPEGEEFEVAEGEYYHEQEEASAPSWLYIVDGCTVVE